MLLFFVLSDASLNDNGIEPAQQPLQGELSKTAWLGAVVSSVVFVAMTGRMLFSVKIFGVAGAATNWAWNARTWPDVANICQGNENV